VGTNFRLLENDGVSAQWAYSRQIRSPRPDADVNPRGVTTASLGYSFIRTELFSPDASLPSPNRRYLYHQGDLTFAHYLPLPFTRPWWDQHTVWLKVSGGFKSRNVSINDQYFLGGRLDYRAFGQISSNTLFYGYEDYSVTGETQLLLSTGYTIPLARAMDWKWGPFFIDSVYASLFGEAGNAWPYGEFRSNAVDHPTQPGNGEILLEDVGLELRLKAFLFSDANVWNSLFRMTYGFQDDAAHGFQDDDAPLRFYVGIGTNF